MKNKPLFWFSDTNNSAFFEKGVIENQNQFENFLGKPSKSSA
jgi:hypothetical protein